MRQTLTIATASINTTPLDLDGNLALLRAVVASAVQQQSRLIAVAGTGADRLWLRRHVFLRRLD